MLPRRGPGAPAKAGKRRWQKLLRRNGHAFSELARTTAARNYNRAARSRLAQARSRVPAIPVRGAPPLAIRATARRLRWRAAHARNVQTHRAAAAAGVL